MVNTYAVQSGGCRFESLWGFGSFLKCAHYEVDYCGKKTYLAGLQCTLTSSCATKVKGDPSKIFKKLRENFFNESFEQCHSAEKCKRGDPLGFFDIHCVAKYRNKRRGDPSVESKKLQNESHSAEKKSE